MLTNTIDMEGMHLEGITRRSKCDAGSLNGRHCLLMRPNFTRNWLTKTNLWSNITTKYAKVKCVGCKTRIRTYCKCNRKVPLCTECYGSHLSNCSITPQTILISIRKKRPFMHYLYCTALFHRALFFIFFSQQLSTTSKSCCVLTFLMLKRVFYLKGIQKIVSANQHSRLF